MARLDGPVRALQSVLVRCRDLVVFLGRFFKRVGRFFKGVGWFFTRPFRRAG
jgi:predicted nucleic acid-binding Zn ribbon protein